MLILMYFGKAVVSRETKQSLMTLNLCKSAWVEAPCILANWRETPQMCIFTFYDSDGQSMQTFKGTSNYYLCHCKTILYFKIE